MASNTIKGLTVEIGGDTTQLGKAIENAEKKSAGLSQELGQINRLLKFDPGNVELLTQKQKVLTEAVDSTREKLDTLKEAERQVQAQFERGEASEEQVRALQREIIETTNKMERYEAAVAETAQELQKLEAEADDAAEAVDDAGDSAKDAEDKTEDLGSALDGTLATGFTAVAAAATAAFTALVACAEATEEYRREMGKLDTAFTTNGHTSEAATETYKELQSILGETDQAVEAANHLALLADNEEELKELTHALTGVYATFGASLPLEGLTEAANESAKVGAVVGPLADALNWANASTEDWTVALSGNNKALKAFNKAVADGEATEDAYTAALEACSDEQERQKLITATLTKFYGKAAAQYKITNKEVIRSNKANEEWTATMAELGEEIAPVITDFKEFGTSLAKDAAKPVENMTRWVRDELLPALIDTSNWVKNNTPVIQAGLTAVTVGFVAYKAAVLAAEVAQKGLKGAIVATEIAQKALNLAQAATPWGLAAVAIGAVVAGLVAYQLATEETIVKVEGLTEEEKELLTAAQDTAQALRDQRAATEETANGIMSHMDYVGKLTKELNKLADSSGRVKDTDQVRAQFILNELNEALGTEYTMTDGVIQKYDALKKSIDSVIESKTANALLEARNQDYVAALEAENQLLQNMALAEKDYQAQKEHTQKLKEELAEEEKILNDRLLNDATYAASILPALDAAKLKKKEEAWLEEQALLTEKETQYNEALEAYGTNAETIMSYEEAQTEAYKENYDRTIEILKGKATGFYEYAENVDEATKTALNTLYKEAIDAGLEAERTRRNFEAGVEGYTEEMVKEAEDGYEDALDAFATAKADAESVGEDIGSGLGEGMEKKRTSVITKVKNIVSSIIAAARKEADSHSPSRKMIAFGEDMGEGAEIGLENKTEDVIKAAETQVSGALDAYKTGLSTEGQVVFNAVQRQDSNRSAASQQSAAADTNKKLDRLVEAVERGQVLTIDGDKLVGGTADKFDDTLGQRRILAARGAI